jgi:hypothetical protein
MSEHHPNGLLPDRELDIARAEFRRAPDQCVDEQGKPLPTMRAWLDYCQYCFDQYGAVPSGT